MIGLKRSKETLDKKKCFDAWIKCGSVYKARYLLKNDDGTPLLNERTGKVYSHQAIWDGAWRYILENLPEGRKEVESVWRANGSPLTDDDWYPLVIKSAKYIYSYSKYKQFLEKHSYLTPYVKS